jgi:ABC-type uncharacterized transport system permease subunit
MWKERYRKTLIPNQVGILLVCLILAFYVKMPWIGVLAYFLVMQLGALLGAMWTSRLLKKFDRRRRDELDLKLL